MKPKNTRLAAAFVMLGLAFAAAAEGTADFQERVKTAERGDRQAQYELALAYETGDGVESDLEKAAKMYLRAAKKGHADAQANLGAMYQEGRGVKADTKV